MSKKKHHKKRRAQGYGAEANRAAGGQESYGYGSYGYGADNMAGQNFNGGMGAGLGSAEGMDPATEALLNKARLDPSGLLQGLPDLLRSRHSEQFLLGLLVGGAAAWVLSDEELRGKLIKAGIHMYGRLAGGVEEFKEQMADVRAEVEAEKHGE